MGYPHKIVTCCYCGTRAALVLRGRTRHELSCSSCGAPLHDLKMLPRTRSGDRELVDRPAPVPARSTPSRSAPARPAAYGKPRKKRKGLLRKAFEEAFDILEDIFD